jgi:5-methylcytosine-specific restriction endonuclease McrA
MSAMSLITERARKRQYYESNREKELARAKRYREENRQTMLAAQRKWREEHPEYAAQWYREHRDDNRDAVERYRTNKRGAFVERISRQRVFERDEGICGICGDPVDRDDFHIDHVISLSKGGKHSYGNVQVAHPSCNIAKGNR